MSISNAWEEYKKNLGATRPWDMFNSNTEKASHELAYKRLEMCRSCPELIQATAQCKKCGCFMKAKTKIKNATCPLSKWDE